MNTVEKLEALAEIDAQKTIIAIDQEAKRNEIMAPVQAQIDALMATVNGQLADLEAEYAPKVQALSDNYAKVEAEVRAEVLAGGATVKGSHLMAVWSKGRVTWDTKILDGLMIAVPQLALARKEGDPSVLLRKVS